jgi:hypothetical protein
MMKISKAVILVVILAGLLAGVQAGAGLFIHSDGQPFDFTTLHGDTVQINGQGLYHFDTAFKTPIARGTDAVTLFGALPLLIIAILFYRRGTLSTQILLAGVLSYFIYNAASVAFGTAFNNFFPEYIAYFSASLFAFVLVLIHIDYAELGRRLQVRGLPSTGMAVVMFLSGAALLFAWVPDILAWMAPGAIPGIASYTTEVTHVLDLGIIAPATITAGVLALRRQPAGYVMSAILMILLAIIAFVLLGQTVFQTRAGYTLSPGVFIGKNGSFMALALVAIWLLVRFLRGGRKDGVIFPVGAHGLCKSE